MITLCRNRCRPAELGYREVQFHFDVTPGLSLQLAMLFLDAQKQRISSVVKTGNSNQSAEIPAGTEMDPLRTAHLRQRQRPRSTDWFSGTGSLRPAVIIGRARKHLVLTNQYPAMTTSTATACPQPRGGVSERVRVDVFRLRPRGALAFHEFHNVDVISGSPEALHKLLLGDRYQSVLVHFLDEEMWQVLQQHIEDTRVYVWVHGAEIQPWHRRDYNYETEEQRDAASSERSRAWPSGSTDEPEMCAPRGIIATRFLRRMLLAPVFGFHQVKLFVLTSVSMILSTTSHLTWLPVR